MKREMATIAAVYKSYHPRWNLKGAEELLIRQRLREGYSPEDICHAVHGHHMRAFHIENKFTAFAHVLSDKNIDANIDSSIEHDKQMSASRELKAKEDTAYEAAKQASEATYQQMARSGDRLAKRFKQAVREVSDGT